MLDGLKELRRQGKENNSQGREFIDEIETLLNNIKDTVSQAKINYETSITTQEPPTSKEQQQARGLQEPDQPDSGSLEQGIVKMD